MSATRVRVDNPLTMSTTHARVDNARPRPCPENAPVRPRTAARRDYAPRVPGGFPRKAESTTGCLGCPRARGMPYFLLQWEERNERCPLVSRDCLCPPRVRGTPARARAGPRSGFPQVVRHPWGYAHKNPDLQNTHRAQGGDPALCAAPCSLIPFLVCDTEKERGQDPRGTRRTGHSCCTA